MERENVAKDLAPVQQSAGSGDALMGDTVSGRGDALMSDPMGFSRQAQP